MKMNDLEKFCCVSLDEMSVKAALSYDVTEDKIQVCASSMEIHIVIP